MARSDDGEERRSMASACAAAGSGQPSITDADAASRATRQDRRDRGTLPGAGPMPPPGRPRTLRRAPPAQRGAGAEREEGRPPSGSNGLPVAPSAAGTEGGPVGEPDLISVRGAREHNLRDVDVDLPRDQLDRLHRPLGLAASRRLAFDTIYAEGQRRYVESLSAYARQFLGQMDKPDVDFIEGLSPGDLDRPEVGVAQPALDRRHGHRDLRLPPPPLRADRRPALPELRPRDHARRRSRSSTACSSCPRAPASRCSRRWCAAARASTSGLLEELAGQGFTRARIDGEVVELTDRKSERLARYENHTIEVVVDRLVRRPGIERRLTDSLETALRLAEGVAEVEIVSATPTTGRPGALPGPMRTTDDDRRSSPSPSTSRARTAG